MQSKTLFCKHFNKTLFRKNLTRFWPLWAAPSFIGALFPLAYLTQMLRYTNMNLSALEVTAMYYEVITYGLPILSLGYAILVALAVWSYLFNARSVGLMHTLPLQREGLFLTNFLSGMAMMLIPYAVTGTLAVVIFACCGAFNPLGILVTILSVIGESLFYFSSATLVAFITGNLFALPVLYAIFHFLAVLMDFLVNLFASGFLFGLNGDYSGVVEFLSPTVYLMTHVRCNRSYTEVFVRDAINGVSTPDGIGYYESELIAVSLEKGWLIAAYAGVGLVLLGIAYALYRKRCSESAGDVVAVGWMKPIFRYGVAICGAMAGGLALYAIFWGAFQYGKYYDVIPLAIAMLLAGAIAYYTASMLLAKSLRVFRGSWKGLGITLLCAAAICCTMYFDVFGAETRVPTADKIDYVSFHAADNNYDLYPAEDAELLEEVRKLHLAIAEDADYIIAANENWHTAGEEQDDISRYNYIRINYYLKNGTSVMRRYEVPITRTRLQDASTYDYQLSTLVNSEAMKSKRFHLEDGFVPYNGDIYLETTNEGTSFGNREAARIMAAVAKDVAAGTCGTYSWFTDTSSGHYSGNDYAMDLSVSFQKERVAAYGQPITEHDYIGIRVRPEMTNTVDALLELGLATRETLKTRAQLHPQDYNEAYLEYAKTFDISYEEFLKITGEAASVGIIGGADGPTKVFVTGG